uniref:Putative cullin n=1 Tax=Ixodes ricinus TaxID=34613 RepID=A0A6B0VG44_IXORI
MSLKPKRIDFEGTWEQLKDTVAGVITLGKVPRPIWNDRFSDVYALCVAFPEPLGDRLYQETKKFLNAHVQYLYELVLSGDDLLATYYKHWLEYSQGIDYLNKLYMYLNTQHIKKHKLSEADLSYGSVEPTEQLLEVGELGLDLWRRNMVAPLRHSLVSLLLEALSRDREGHCPQQRVVQGVIHSFVQVEEYKRKQPLSLYQEMFEGPFLQETGKHYQREAHRLLEECDCSSYMERVLQCLAQENLRARRFLHPSSYPKVTRECEQHMVGAHLGFLQQECAAMVKGERRTDLGRMYTLLRPLGARALEALVAQLQKHVERVGLDRLVGQGAEQPQEAPPTTPGVGPSEEGGSSSSSGAQQQQQQPPPSLHPPGGVSPQHFVEAVLQVHSTYQNLVKEVFQGDQQFVGALDKACATIINNRGNTKQPCRSPELLAKYCDALLKKSAKGISESEVEDRLTQSITVFKYIDDKDVFQKFYAKMLAKRLIHSQSMSMDVEEAMINKLKQACGYEFTSKLHRMFTDMSVSADLNNKFNSYLKTENIDLGINFSIYILQAGAWPLGQSAVSPFAIPQELERSVQKFEQFYGSKFSGRKLTWLQHLCQAEVRLCYLRKSYLVSLGTYQMALLLPFEGADSLAVRDLQEATQLSQDQLQRQLQGLLDARLLSSPEEGPITPSTVLYLNKSYSNKRTKFKISAVVQKEAAQQEMEQTHSSVDEDRKLYLQAAVVRIMKARKVLRHNTLIQEVINQAKNRFVPSIAMIKKCIEALIDKQYLERTPNSTDEYCYVA